MVGIYTDYLSIILLILKSCKIIIFQINN